MDFIISFAHFCEVHGPTPILCTQAILPSCQMCCPLPVLRPSFGRPAGASAPPQSSLEYPPPTRGGNASIARTSVAGGMPASSPQITSPSDHPLSSPQKSHIYRTLPPRNRGGRSGEASSTRINGGSADLCRNCTITFPKALSDSLPAKLRSAKRPPLRSTETVVVVDSLVFSSLQRGKLDFDASDQRPRTAVPCTHTHTITYVSGCSLALPSHHATVRQSCIRSLSCEWVPAQSPMMFGDHFVGYTIALVFKLADTGARGGRRTYALLCMSSNQKALMQSWNAVMTVFQSLVREIQRAAADKEARDQLSQMSPCNEPVGSVSSLGPEGFLRRRALGNGAMGRSLADLLGREDIFVEIHARFVRLLSMFAKVFGCCSPFTPPIEHAAQDGRGRARSVGDATAEIGKNAWTPQPQPTDVATPKPRAVDVAVIPTQAPAPQPTTVITPVRGGKAAVIMKVQVKEQIIAPLTPVLSQPHTVQVGQCQVTVRH